MTKPKRLFHRFRQHETVTVVSYDREKRKLTYDIEGGAGGLCDRLQAGMDFDCTTLQAGVRLRLQYGETTRWTSSMAGGTRRLVIGGRTYIHQIHAGSRCISAIAHVQPRVTLLGLRAMEHILGPDETARHLADFAKDGSSLQTEIDEKQVGKPLWMRIENGILRAGAVLMRDPLLRIENGFVQVRCGDLPETLVNALTGEHVGALVDHPALRDTEFVIDRHHANGDLSHFFLDRTVLTIDEALIRLRPIPLPKAA